MKEIEWKRWLNAIEPYCKHRIIIQSTKELAQADSLRIHSSDLELINTMEYLIPFQVLSFLIADEMGIDLSIPLVASLDDAMTLHMRMKMKIEKNYEDSLVLAVDIGGSKYIIGFVVLRGMSCIKKE